jgi:hypothetical protein
LEEGGAGTIGVSRVICPMPKTRNDKDIFDRSFKLIMNSLSPKALIYFINRLFGSNHPLDSEPAPPALA